MLHCNPMSGVDTHTIDTEGREASTSTPLCSKGHPVVGENVKWGARGKGSKQYEDVPHLLPRAGSRGEAP